MPSGEEYSTKCSNCPPASPSSHAQEVPPHRGGVDCFCVCPQPTTPTHTPRCPWTSSLRGFTSSTAWLTLFALVTLQPSQGSGATAHLLICCLSQGSGGAEPHAATSHQAQIRITPGLGRAVTGPMILVGAWAQWIAATVLSRPQRSLYFAQESHTTSMHIHNECEELLKRPL